MSSAKLHGRVRISSCARRILSQPVAHAFTEPGRQNTNVPFATPARQRDCRLDVPISSYDSIRNISPKPCISLSSSTATASGVPSRPVTPVPPVVITTSTPGSAIHADTTARIAYTSSLTMRFSASRWPLAVTRSTRSAPDLSVASVRVSETVSTAIDSGRNSLLIDLCVERRVNGEIVRHHERVLTTAVIRGAPPRLAIAELRVELAGARVAFAELEPHEENSGRARGRLEPLEQPSADALQPIAGMHGEQVQVRVRVEELHDAEACDAATVARDDDGALRMPDAAHDPGLRPRPRQPVLDQRSRHLRDLRRVIAPCESQSDVHGSSIVPACAPRHDRCLPRSRPSCSPPAARRGSARRSSSLAATVARCSFAPSLRRPRQPAAP